ncbi:SpoIIIAC/SpoIIIAD family protein [uncultured Shewanella sp.]|uniref:SpoIIIAC/SpoIIIAD family protein n=1 Tax=uncultured Shewanella sp. TaxID=173975 RepID=UPI002636E93A|nr:SpoIIIAC/SpoIIIAD family protein [uncultured Shewanella sp.]
MTRCPHCQNIANPFRFMLMTKWRPYLCAKCGKQSAFSMKANKIISLLSVIAGMAAGLGYFEFISFLGQDEQAWYIELATFILVFVAIMTLVKGLFLKLRPI